MKNDRFKGDYVWLEFLLNYKSAVYCGTFLYKVDRSGGITTLVNNQKYKTNIAVPFCMVMHDIPRWYFDFFFYILDFSFSNLIYKDVRNIYSIFSYVLKWAVSFDKVSLSKIFEMFCYFLNRWIWDEILLIVSISLSSHFITAFAW